MLVNFSDIQNATNADAEVFNSRYGAILDVLNGNIDATNLADDSITTSKLANTSVTPAKMALTKTTDANGWTCYDYGSWKVYKRRGIMSHTVTGSGWSYTPTLALPVGIFTIGTNFVEGAAASDDAAISVSIYNHPSVGYISFACTNAYSLAVTSNIVYSLSITTS